MANYSNLLAQIAANIYSNNNQEITGDILQLQLNAMVASLGDGYQFMGVAHPYDNPTGFSDVRAAWVAFDAGTYPNFGGATLIKGQIGVFLYDTDWTFIKSIAPGYQITSLNRFDRDDLTFGYVIYSSGVISPNSGYRTSNYIPVTPGKAYRIYNNGNQQLALYNAQGVYVSGYSTSNSFNNADDATQIPSGAAYLRFCMPNANVSTACFYEKDEYTARNAWENITEYKLGIVADGVRGGVQERSISVSTMTAFIAYLNSIIDTENYHYTIFLEEGTYTITPAQIDANTHPVYGRIGLLIPDNTDIIGKGNGATIVCDLTGEESGYQSYISTINIKWNNRLKNLTIIANNCRYAVHCDNSNTSQDIRWEIEDCNIVHFGNSDGEWAYPHAWGEGGCSGHYAKFKNCTFRSSLGAFYLHNAANLDKPMHHDFIGCKFISTNKTTAFTAESLGSGTKDVLNFIGCSFEGLFDSRAVSGSGVTSCDFVVIGGGNSPVCENWYYTDGVAYHSTFGDETIEFYNRSSETIPAGTFMKYDGDDLVPMVNGDDGKLFVGFLLDNVPNGGTGYVKFRGTYRVTSPADVVWATLGTKVKVANYNTLAVADDIYNIGKMYYRNTAFTRYYILIG